MKKDATLILASILLLSLLSMVIFQTETTKATDIYVNIEPIDDSVIFYGNNDPHGNLEYMTVRNAGGGGIYEVDSLVKFSLSSIPDDATIISATLKLYYFEYNDNSPAGRNLNLYRITGDWNEETLGWGNRPSYASQPTTSATVPGSYGWMSWDVTTDVQGFVSGSFSNYGWKITDENYWGGGNIPVVKFQTKEHESYIPYLKIEVIPSVVYVDDNAVSSWYDYAHVKTIQEGIDNVSSGGTIHVYGGTYHENVVVNKAVTLAGENKDTTIIDGGGSGDVVYVSVGGVTITGFTIRNSGGTGYDSGLDVDSNGNTISHNIITNAREGIRLRRTRTSNVISDNTVSNSGDGIWLYYSDGNTISGNIISNNNWRGILLQSSNDNTISDNTITSNTNDGVYLEYSDDRNIISGNTLSGNTYGVRLRDSSDYNTVFHNNFYNNNYNGCDDGVNSWDNGAEGNYWDDYTGVDGNGDGIGDTPYNIPCGSSHDRYPFMNKDGWKNNPPVADAGGPYYANVNNAITFDGSGSRDTDGTITGYRWDWTNNGTYDTGWLTSATTTHSYSSAGTYTVKLQVKDNAGVTDTDTATATITPDDGAIPTAEANGPYTGYVNYSVAFSSSGSVGGSEGTIVSWYWTFGDGDVSSQQNPTHKYTTSGTYTVTLKVTNNYGQTDTDTTTATITGLSSGQTPPVADAGGPYSGVVGSPIMFDGSDSNDSDGTIVSYGWNFGDGTTGTGITPTHTYTTAGNYTVVLTVTDDDSLTHSNSTIASINVSGPPTILIFIDISNIEPIEEENEKTIPVTVFCYHQSVYNIHLEILESSNLTVTLLSPNITLIPGESRELLIKVKVPKLEANVTVGSETLILRAHGDGNITSNTEQINLKVVEKNVTVATPGFETIATITAIGIAGALTSFFRRRNGNR